MQWVQVGEPEVERQRGKWVVRQRGYDAATGRRRIKQLGTFATKRAAVAHRKAAVTGRAGSDNESLADYLEVLVSPAAPRPSPAPPHYDRPRSGVFRRMRGGSRVQARVTRFEVEPSRIDEANEYYRGTVLTQARELTGFNGGVALVDRESGGILTFTLWESEEAMRSSEDAADRIRGQAGSDLGFSAPSVERYEVGVLEIG